MSTFFRCRYRCQEAKYPEARATKAGGPFRGNQYVVSETNSPTSFTADTAAKRRNTRRRGTTAQNVCAWYDGAKRFRSVTRPSPLTPPPDRLCTDACPHRTNRMLSITFVYFQAEMLTFANRRAPAHWPGAGCSRDGGEHAPVSPVEILPQVFAGRPGAVPAAQKR